jgi:hypothetical protein
MAEGLILDACADYIPEPDGDGYVGVQDILAMGPHFGQKPGIVGWDHRVDLDGNGVINVADILLASRQFGRLCIEFPIKV